MARKAKKAPARGKGESKSGDTIHAFVEQLLMRTKKPYAEIAAMARKQFGGETSSASVRHYASKLRSAKPKVKVPDRPSAREASFA